MQNKLILSNIIVKFQQQRSFVLILFANFIIIYLILINKFEIIPKIYHIKYSKKKKKRTLNYLL